MYKNSKSLEIPFRRSYYQWYTKVGISWCNQWITWNGLSKLTFLLRRPLLLFWGGFNLRAFQGGPQLYLEAEKGEIREEDEGRRRMNEREGTGWLRTPQLVPRARVLTLSCSGHRTEGDWPGSLPILLKVFSVAYFPFQIEGEGKTVETACIDRVDLFRRTSVIHEDWQSN